MSPRGNSSDPGEAARAPDPWTPPAPFLSGARSERSGDSAPVPVTGGQPPTPSPRPATPPMPITSPAPLAPQPAGIRRDPATGPRAESS
jgi:hypothetical protein